MDDEILSFFIEESTELITELKELGNSLKGVRVPSKEESENLSDFAQKLNRLIGGTASMGFVVFTPLSRNTSLLAAKCAKVREISIRVIIHSMNEVVSILEECFKDLASIKESEIKIPMIEKRIDMCMVAFGISDPEIKDQDQIDDILYKFDKPRLNYKNAINKLMDTLDSTQKHYYMEEEKKLQDLLKNQEQTQDPQLLERLFFEFTEIMGKSQFKDTRLKIAMLKKQLQDGEVDAYF